MWPVARRPSRFRFPYRMFPLDYTRVRFRQRQYTIHQSRPVLIPEFSRNEDHIGILAHLFCQVSQAQQQHACGHAEMEELLLQKHPALLHERAALEQFTATYTAHRQQRVLSDTILFIIPVVFHIMHNYGEENISREQIVDAVRIMNEYYQNETPIRRRSFPVSTADRGCPVGVPPGAT